ncbi:MAG: hypothetical protein SX243_08935 [Acidobacteriota bacterium]|nr:hypothetical protein [Acidobacteriota bacterium]
MNQDGCRRKLEAIIDKLKGLTCWSYVAGSGTGSVVALDFGRKIRRARPLRNPSLTEDQRTFEGEISILVECAWRVDSRTQVLGGSANDNRQGMAMLKSLGKLIGCRVADAKALAPGYDLLIDFEEGLRFEAFAVETNLEDDVDNYSIHTEKSILTVGAGSLLREEPRKGR